MTVEVLATLLTAKLEFQCQSEKKTALLYRYILRRTQIQNAAR